MNLTATGAIYLIRYLILLISTTHKVQLREYDISLQVLRNQDIRSIKIMT